MQIEILSPLHIGTGDKKNRMAFLEEDGKAYFIDENYLFSLLRKGNRIDKFVEWVENGETDIGKFLSPQEKKQLKEKLLYSLPVKGKIDREVQLHIKDAKNRFYIPGSSIKGAIRTALLYATLKRTNPPLNELLYGKEGTDIEGIMNVSPSKPREVGFEVEKYVFRAGVYDDEKKIIRYNDGKYDLLRFIYFSDAYPQNANFCIMPVRTFSYIKKDLMNVKSFITNVETIESGSLTTALEIDMNSLLSLKRVKENKSWLGLREKFRNVYGFNLEELSLNNLEEYKNRIIQKILLACNEFAKEKRKRDLKLIDGKKISVCKECWTSVDRHNKCLKCRTIRSENQIQLFDLKELKNIYPKDNIGTVEIGFGTGWEGTTVGNFFSQTLIKNLRKQYELGKIKYKISCRSCGEFIDELWGTKATNWTRELNRKHLQRCPKCGEFLRKETPKTDVQSLFFLFPKTIRLAFWDGTFLPLGWVRIREE